MEKKILSTRKISSNGEGRGEKLLGWVILPLGNNHPGFKKSISGYRLGWLIKIITGLVFFFGVVFLPGAAAAQGRYYKVKEGDCLWIIAQRNRVSVNSIKRVNGLKSDFLKPGQLLLIPVKSQAGRGSAGNRLQSTAKPYIAPSRSTDAVRGLLDYALSFLGTRYRWSGESPDTGFDCSGFTKFIFGRFGCSLPHSAAEQVSCGMPVERGELSPGDLLLFRTLGPRIDHAAIYCGGGKFIHASSRGGCVRVDSLDEEFWDTHFVAARRLLKAL